MPDTLLVGYASQSGSTEEAAEFIALNLAEYGYMIDLLSVNYIRKLTGYRLIVLGAPLYYSHLHRDMRRFLKAHQSELAATPVAFYALGPVHKTDEEYNGAKNQLAKELAKLNWFKPFDVQLFTGMIDPAKLGFPYKLIPRIRELEMTDERNWDQISAWVESLAKTLENDTF